MHILHLALGGCLKAPPVDYGITADTGGHIAYVLEAALAQGRLPDVDRVTIVTRRFADSRLGTDHARPRQQIAARVWIERIATPDPAYLEKEALTAELPAFTEALCDHIDAAVDKPDIIHAHFADAAMVAGEVERRFGVAFVYTPHSLGIDKQRQSLDSPGLSARIESERAAIRSAAAIIVSSREEASRQVSRYAVDVAARAHVIAPGVPRQHLDAPSAAPDLLHQWFTDPHRPIILAVARPVPKKNLAALIRLYGADARLHGMANLVVLAGQHDHADLEEAAVLDELRSLAGQPHLVGRVALPARHAASDVAALYALAAKGGVFVNPALHEPFGLTLLEAAAAGVPVVATDRGGAAEIVATIGHGQVVDPSDEPAMADAIHAILHDPRRHRAHADAARRNVRAYDWGRYAAASTAVYAAAATPGLLACDIDNTLTGSRTAAAAFAAWARNAALPFVVATGRSLPAARGILARWGLPMPEAFIVDVGTRIMLPDGRGDWAACPQFAAALDKDWDRDAVAATLAPVKVEPQPPETMGPHKLSYFGDERDAACIRGALAAAGLSARVIFSHGRLIDVIAPGGGKARAIAAYGARLGLSLAQCVAAGDSGNDADMLTACGNAIVVGNAGDELAGLRERAGLYRAAAHHADGVLEGLARLGLCPALAAKVA